MNVTNALVSGQEIVMGSRGAPRWAETTVGTTHRLLAGGTKSDDNTIFRVWSTDADIVLRMEEYDTVRTIHMDDAEPGEARAKSLLGYSRGHWEDSTLVVATSAIDWAYFDKEGIPQGDAMSVVERFTPSEDGSRLEYSMTVTDSEVFTEPVTLERHWVWRPGEEINPYNCTWGD